MQKYEISEEDSVLIIRENGQVELMLPNKEPDEEVSQTSLAIFALSLALKDQEIMNQLFAKMDEEIKNIEDE